MRISPTRARALSLAGAGLALLALSAGGASAAHYDLDLTGTVANLSLSSFDSGGTHFDQGVLNLQGLDGSNAITVQQGDTISATVTLDQALTVPMSQQLTVTQFFLFGSAFPDVDTGVTDIVNSFFLAGNPGVTGGGTTTTRGQLAAGNVLFPPDNGPLTFDRFTSSFTIETLSQDATLDSSEFTYTLFSASATPEPASWALMLVGFGGLGAMLRTARRNAGLARGG